MTNAKTPPLKKQGGQSKYTSDIANSICERIAEGEPLYAICREKGMPAWRTVYDWIAARPEFAAGFARAREVGFDAIAAQALQIADTPQEGVRHEATDDGKTKEVREDMLGHRKLQIETRLKLLAKWSPQRYGEKIEQTLQGPDGNGLRIEIVNYAAVPQEKP